MACKRFPPAGCSMDFRCAARECWASFNPRYLLRSMESAYSPPAFCGSRDTSARMFRFRIKRWR
jgi:hypothetical protein